jgi:hypothetical protein
MLVENVADVSEVLKAAKHFLNQPRAPLDLRVRRLSRTASIGSAVGAEGQPEELMRTGYGRGEVPSQEPGQGAQRDYRLEHI